MDGYRKTLDDEIDWKLIDQLHSATLNFSSTSLELKKIFFTLIGIAVPILIKLANERLECSLFITLYILILTFWFLDSFTYYYQEKLREKMDKIFSRIKERNKESTLIVAKNNNSYTIESTRSKDKRIFRSAFNSSLGIYPILLLLTSICSILYWKGIIY
jgi:ABC-type multidrug transport system fused ATPase/permease subunit